MKRSVPAIVLLYIALGVMACSGAPSAPSVGFPAPEVIEDTAVIPRDSRPNIILILVDDMDLLLGSQDVMPNLKEYLVDEGLTLDPFLITTSVCCPARVTFLRGQYTHNHQVYMNEGLAGGYDKFYARQLESSTVGTWLQAAGYRTAYIGKYLNAFPFREAREYIPPGWTDWFVPARGRPYTGFNYTLNENGHHVAYGEGEQEYITDVMTEHALEVIRQAGKDSEPLFLFLSYYPPHEPATPAPRHAQLFLDAQAPRIPNFNPESVEGKPGFVTNNPVLDEETLAAIDERHRLRLQSLQSVDEAIARLVAELTAAGLLENTFIIFTSDNGFHLGQHRLRWGKASPYEEDIRVPFVIRGPGISAGEFLQDYLASNVDFGPTIADLVGVQPPAYVDGRSLVPLFFAASRPNPADWRQGVLIEFFGHRSDDTGVIAPVYQGIRTLEYMYLEHDDGTVELYDLATDPYQLSNLAGGTDPDVLSVFAAWLKRLAACSAAECYRAENRE